MQQKAVSRHARLAAVLSGLNVRRCRLASRRTTIRRRHRRVFVSLLDLNHCAWVTTGTIGDVFESLSFKARAHFEPKPGERDGIDRACRMALGLLGDQANHAAFTQTARSFLCVKASLDPHDIRFSAAIFEDAYLVKAEWRLYLLASSVHSLHGTRSADASVLWQVRDALILCRMVSAGTFHLQQFRPSC